MKDILAALIESFATQSLALQAVADDVLAMKRTLLFFYPEMEEDLNRAIAEEREKNRAHVQQLQSQLAELRGLVARMSN